VAYYWEIVVRLRATIFVAAIAFIILSQPTQIIELYLIDIEGVLGRLSGPETQLSSALLAASPMAVPVSYTLAAYAFLATVGCGLAMLQIFASPQVKRLANGLFAPSGILVALLTPIIIAGAVLIWPIGIASAVGTIPLILLFIGVLAVVLASFSHIYQRTGCPLTVIVSALGVAFAILGWNDNHRVDYTDGGPARDFKFGFTQWLQQRGDLAYFADKRQPYPVYIIAAEGGGMAAGYHLAAFLAKLQETCPTFAQHIFAISSVSGGSLGAAQFAAQASTSIKNVPP
jgi:hypothetical protein